MNTDKRIKLIGTIVGIVFFIALIAGMTYAWITWRSSNTSISGNTDCFEVNYTTGQSINNENVLLFDESSIINNGKITIKNGMAITDVTAYMDSKCNTPASLDIILNVTNLNDAFITGNSVGAFKYVVARYDPSVYSDITVSALNGLEFDIINNESITSTGEKIILTEGLSSTEKGYLIIFYIDGDLAMNDAGNTSFTASISGVASQVGGAYLIEHITNLYTTGNPTLITHSKDDGTSDTYYYSYQDEDETWGLMNDGLKVSDTYGAGATKITDTETLTSGTEGNIRYYGDKPNNYIYFNCSDYSNQSDSTCEKWRIIGIVDGKVKIRNNTRDISLDWDSNNSNNWSTSTLNEYLNGSYYNSLNKKNSKTIELISKSTWYLGGYSTSQIYPNEIYNYERTNVIGTTIYGDNPYTVTANVGLMYVSDYGYAKDLTEISQTLSSGGWTNWSSMIYDDFWFITPFSDRSNLVFIADDILWLSTDGTFLAPGRVFHNTPLESHGGSPSYALPTLYLNSNVFIDSVGDGTSKNPYRIYVN